VQRQPTDDASHKLPSARSLRWRVLGRIALGFAIGGLGSFSFLMLRLPLPYFLGSLALCLVAAVFHAPFERPQPLSAPVRAVLGVAIGAAFSPALLGRIPGMAPSLMLLIPYMLVIMTAGVMFFERLARFDRATAFFSAVPGGLTDMVTMAADAGASVRTVTLIQSTRIVLLIFAVPFWVQWTNGIKLGGVVPRTIHIWELSPLDGLVLVGLALVGWQVARFLRLAGAALVGPMIASGLAHALGGTAAKVPFEVLAFAQITLGVLLGAQFRGLTWTEFRTTMVWGLVFALALLGLTGVTALEVSRWTGFDSISVLLAYAPGGQSELNLLALVLGLDVAFVALHHLVRLAVVILGAQLVFATKKDWRNRDP
jgi:membrane AbrB-like protein